MAVEQAPVGLGGALREDPFGEEPLGEVSQLDAAGPVVDVLAAGLVAADLGEPGGGVALLANVAGAAMRWPPPGGR